jgi:glutamyl-tRNA reductase
VIVVVGFSHKNAPIEVRERLAIGRDALPGVLDRLTAHPAVGEAVMLSTCNRVEIYAAPRARAAEGGAPRRPGSIPPPGGALASQAEQALENAAIHGIVSVLGGIGGEAIRGHLAGARGTEAVRHLFRVASSLESLVVGEPQILGQLKDAIEIAREARTLGPRLGQAMHRAIKVGKRVRSETAIGAGQVSVSSVAIDLARQIFSDLAGRSALLVGAGEMAEAASKLLVRAGARLVVVNRSPERAAALARDVGGEPRPWAELERSVVEADIVVSSTSSPNYVISLDLVRRARKARRGRSLFLIDIAVPRDIDPAVNDLDNVFLYDVDDLSQIVSESREGRAAEAARAEEIVREETQGFATWTLERALTPTIVDLRSRTRAILASEVERSLSGKLRHLGVAERQALAVMIEAATNKLLHVPITRLRALASDPRAAENVDALRDLFDLDSVPAEEPGPIVFDAAPSSSNGKTSVPPPPDEAALARQAPGPQAASKPPTIPPPPAMPAILPADGRIAAFKRA